MGDWSYLSYLLDKVQAHSTVVGKIWMSVLFLFRIFVLSAAADKVWSDEVSQFYCDSLEPGCSHACYNWRFPISYVHYWVLQITLVSTPTLVYLGHAVHVIHREKQMMKQRILNTPRYTDHRGKVKIKGILFCTYMTQLFFKILLEVAFCTAQFYIFGSLLIDPFFSCKVSPCAHQNGAQCSVSRPTEKSIFIIFMLVVSGISVILNILEMVYLLCNRRREAEKRVGSQQFALKMGQDPSNRAWVAVNFPLSTLPAAEPPCSSRDEQQLDAIQKEKDN